MAFSRQSIAAMERRARICDFACGAKGQRRESALAVGILRAHSLDQKFDALGNSWGMPLVHIPIPREALGTSDLFLGYALRALALMIFGMLLRRLE
jgi:hypothetical protein